MNNFKIKTIAVVSAFVAGNLLINPAEAGLSCAGGGTLGSANITDSTGPGGSACSVTSNGTNATNNASYALIKNNIGNAFNVGTFTGNTLTNAGDIGVSNASSGTALNFGAGGTITTLTNTGNIGGGSTAISMALGSSIGLLDNGGVLGSIVYSGTTYNSTQAINLNGASITTLSNTGTITSASSGYAIYVGGSSTITLLHNQSSGVIGNSTSMYGINVGMGGTITTLTNEGTITSMASPGSGIANMGTITTLNNSQSASALRYQGALPTNYNLKIASPTVFGQISFRSATGTMTVGVGSGSSVVDGTTYASVISGITSSSKFTSTTGTYNSLSWYLSQQGTSGIWDLIFGTPPSSSNSNSNSNSSSATSSRVEGRLARSAILADAAPSAFTTAIGNLSGAALERAVREITPTVVSASGSSSSGTANTVSGMIFEKAGTFNGDMSGIRASQTRFSDAYSLLGALPSSNMQFEQIATTFAANPMSYQPTRASFKPRKFADAEAANYDKLESGRMGGWVQGYFDRGHGETIGASTGFVNKTYGVVGAVEYAVDQNHLAGVYVAQSKTKSEMYDTAGNVDGNQTMLGLYGQKIEDSFRFSGSVAYGLSRYDSTRNITTVANISPAKAKYDGNTYLASLGVSRMFKSGENTIEPFALVNYTITQTDAYSESGATGYNLTVGKSESQVGSVTVGSIFMFPHRWEGKKVEFKVKPAIRFSDEFKKADTATSFVGSSTTTIYDARRIDKTTGMIATEMNLMQDKDTLIKFGIDYQEGRDYASYKIFGQYEWKF